MFALTFAAAVRAFFPQAVCIQIERVIPDVEPALLGNALLALLDFGIAEFFYPATLQADKMVVVFALVEFKHGSASFKMMAFQQTCLLELRQDAIDSCQADILVVLDQLAVNLFGGEVLLSGILEQFQDFEPGMGGLEADVFEAAGVVCHDPDPVARLGGQCYGFTMLYFPTFPENRQP